VTYTFTRPTLTFCDVDGVLAEFAFAFSRLLHLEFGTPITYTREVSDWAWDKQGITKEQFAWGFERIETIPDFWLQCPTLATPEQFKRIADAASRLPILFVTARAPSAGDSVYHQTVRWLEMQGIAEPLVIVSKRGGMGGGTDKADLIEHFNPGLVIEDAPHTAVAFARRGVPVALMDWPYTSTDDVWAHSGYIKLCNLDQALDMAGA
jgi:hypothetical protein